jgi:DNA-binding NarL/FixJ family response regulator
MTMLNVLIADAHPVARSGLHMLVERLAANRGAECVFAFSADAITAFRKAKRLQPDLILLSVDLPLSSGVQAVQALRQYTPHAKLVVVSDEAVAAPQPYLDAGADALLDKRQSVREIEDALSRVLDGPRPVALRRAR